MTACYEHNDTCFPVNLVVILRTARKKKSTAGSCGSKRVSSFISSQKFEFICGQISSAGKHTSPKRNNKRTPSPQVHNYESFINALITQWWYWNIVARECVQPKYETDATLKTNQLVKWILLDKITHENVHRPCLYRHPALKHFTTYASVVPNTKCQKYEFGPF